MKQSLLLALVFFIGCSNAPPSKIQPGTRPVELPCVQASNDACTTNSDCEPDFECATNENGQFVCAKPLSMCANGDACQTNEVCNLTFKHTDHMHLYKHGICLCK